jgi:hypothetical protein
MSRHPDCRPEVPSGGESDPIADGDVSAGVGTSEESRRAFAQRHGLTVSQFDYWKR